MTIQRLPGSAITPGTITVTQLDSATATVIQTGGGPKITNIQVTDAAYTVIDDTAVDTAGGNIRITGTGFVTGCSVIVGSQPASSVAFISSTEVRVQVGAQSAGTYIVYLVNPDGGVGIRVNGLTYSANPAWQTASALPEQYDNVAISLSLVATEATSYTLTSGSLPPGLSLNANTGVITGTVTGVSVDTLYTFTVRATDAQLQDSPRTFTVTITVSDPYFKLTTLLLSGSALSANTVIRDSSTNNFNLTVFGDARASNFTPYGTGWSNYFDGSGDWLVTSNVGTTTGDFTLELWCYLDSSQPQGWYPYVFGTNSPWQGSGGIGLAYNTQSGVADGTPLYFNVAGGGITVDTHSNLKSRWVHLALTRSGSTIRAFLNGTVLASTLTNSSTINTSTFMIGGVDEGGSYGNHAMKCWISNFRFVKDSALYTANFTPATSSLTSITNTALLICQSNRFVDNSANNYSLSRSGDVKIDSFNPFNITNTGVNGSMYFDGTGDYCTTSGNAAFALGTGDFCLETWIYPNSISTGTFDRIVATSDYNGTGFDWTLNTASSALYVAGTAYSISNLVIRSWNHLVYTRSSGVLRGFLNGNLAVYNASATTNVTSTGELRIGTGYSGTAYNGYISNLRIVKGSIPAAYQTSSTTINTTVFSPPTTLLTAVTGTSLLTLQYDQPHNNHTFLDSSSNQFLLTRYGNATQGTFSPFSQSGWSVLLNGSSGITLPNNANYGVAANTDFCWEAFIYMTSLPASNGHYAIWNNRNAPVSACGWQFGFANNSGTYAIVGTLTSGSTDTGVNINLVNQSLATANQWHHIALVRHSGVIYGYWNGVSQGTLSYTSSINAGAGVSGIGWRPNGYNDLYLSGYVSNFRFVNGSAVYPSGTTFTVPTTPLTAVTNTVLLTAASNRFRDLSTQNATVSVQSAPSVQAFAPFAATALYSAAVHGGSAYFDGSGDYLWCLNNVVKQFEPSPSFTFEVWYYDDSTSTAGPSIFEIGGTTLNWNASTGVHIQLNTNYLGSQYFNWSKGDGATTSYTWTAPPSYQWNHFAVCYNGTTTSGWLNGARVFTSTTGWPVPNYDRFSVGGNNVTPGSYFKGYVSNLRWVSGTALYNVANTAIVVPTAPLTSLSNTKLLLSFTDAAILDSTGRNLVETVGDAKTSGVITKFTGGSMYFDGTGDYLAVPANFLHNQLYASNRSFTIEFWIYLQAYAGAGVAATVISTYGGGGGADGWRIETSPNAPANAIRWVSNGSDTACSATIELNTWIHYAFTYNGTTVKVFKNGVLGNTATTSWTNNTGRMFIGTANAGLAFPITGYLTDVRITNAERYTATFTAPTAPARLK